MKIDAKELDHKLLRLGFRDNICGTEMMRCAIKEWEPGMAIWKELYAIVARKCASTPSRVERSLRYAIESAFDRGDHLTISALFGHTISPDKGAPTVGEFVARMARACAIED